jgi:N-methylhydantoinase A
MVFPNDSAARPAVPVYDRDGLPYGVALTGPLVIEEGYSNTVVGPGHEARIDAHGNILISVG